MRELSIDNMVSPNEAWGRNRPQVKVCESLHPSRMRRLEMTALALGHKDLKSMLDFMSDFFFDTHYELIDVWAQKNHIDMDMCLPTHGRHEPREYFSKLKDQVYALMKEEVTG